MIDNLSQAAGFPAASFFGGVKVKYEELLSDIQAQKGLFWKNDAEDGLNEKMQAITAIQAYLLQSGKVVKEYSTEELINYIYNDLFRYSVLTDALEDVWTTKIIISDWNSIKVQLTNGEYHKLGSFPSKQQCSNVLSLLSAEAQIPENAAFACGMLPKCNAQMLILRPPAAAKYQCVITKAARRVFHDEDYVFSEFAAKQELELLKRAVRYGVSLLITGLPGSGISSFLSYLAAANEYCTVLNTGRRESDNEIVLNNKQLQEFIFKTHGGGSNALAFNFPSPLAVLATAQVPAVIAQSAGKDPESGLRYLACSFARQYRCDYAEALMQTCSAFPLIVHLAVLNQQHLILSISECHWNKCKPELRPIWKYYGRKHHQIGTLSEALMEQIYQTKNVNEQQEKGYSENLSEYKEDKNA